MNIGSAACFDGTQGSNNDMCLGCYLQAAGLNVWRVTKQDTKPNTMLLPKVSFWGLSMLECSIRTKIQVIIALNYSDADPACQ